MEKLYNWNIFKSVKSSLQIHCNLSIAIDFWIANTSVLPTLAPLTFDLVSAPALQAYIEHVRKEKQVKQTSIHPCVSEDIQ